MFNGESKKRPTVSLRGRSKEEDRTEFIRRARVSQGDGRKGSRHMYVWENRRRNLPLGFVVDGFLGALIVYFTSGVQVKFLGCYHTALRAVLLVVSPRPFVKHFLSSIDSSCVYARAGALFPKRGFRFRVSRWPYRVAITDRTVGEC